jgi:hypothetical protein
MPAELLLVEDRVATNYALRALGWWKAAGSMRGCGWGVVHMPVKFLLMDEAGIWSQEEASFEARRKMPTTGLTTTALIVVLLFTTTSATVYDLEKLGAVADDGSNYSLMYHNADVLNVTLQKGLTAGDTLIVPNKTFHMYGGILASGLRNVTIQIDGTIKFATDLTIQKLRKAWPTSSDGKVMDCIALEDIEDVIFTSSGTGTLDGNGHKWWGAINYALYSENRPKILKIKDSARLLVEKIHFLDSPYWTTHFDDVNTVTIRYCDIAVRVKAGATSHSSNELTAFNTDGFDLSGANIHIHDCNIWNQDDCVCVKDLNGGKRAVRSENWLVERVHASGLGLTVGSIGCSTPPMHVRNITFRDSTMDNTFKGLYMKCRWCTGKNSAIIEDVLYENITINKPEQWAVWIGPAQQADSSHVCSLAWPQGSPEAKCPISAGVTWR